MHTIEQFVVHIFPGLIFLLALYTSILNGLRLIRIFIHIAQSHNEPKFIHIAQSHNEPKKDIDSVNGSLFITTFLWTLLYYLEKII